MNGTSPEQTKFDVRNVDSTIKGTANLFPDYLGPVLNAIVVLYVTYWLFAPLIQLPQFVPYVVKATGGYRPVAWLIGLVLGIGISHVLNTLVIRVKFFSNGRARFDRIQDKPGWNYVAFGFFVLALLAGVAEVILMINGTTLSRLTFDTANGFKSSYHLAGIVTGIMVTVSLLGSRLNAWYRLSLLILSMVSAHIFWHLSADAYWPYDDAHPIGHPDLMRDAEILSPETEQGLLDWELQMDQKKKE